MANKPAVDNGVIASLGKQLTNKVESGAITRKQASKTSDQRKLLQNAFGDNWRVKVYGKGGAKALPSYGISGGSEVNSLRSKAIQQAKNKLNVNGGTEAKTTLKPSMPKSPIAGRQLRNGGTTAK
jgi:hypothetical protein